MYYGNYNDPLFGNGKQPHALTTLTPASLKNEIDDIGNAGQYLEDENDKKALDKAFENIIRHENSVLTRIQQSLQNSVAVHALAYRYKCDLAIAISFVRLREAAKTLLLDANEILRTADVDKFMLIMEKVYTEVPEGAPIRMKLCSLAREFCRRNSKKEKYFHAALWTVIPKSSRMEEDLVKSPTWA